MICGVVLTPITSLILLSIRADDRYECQETSMACFQLPVEFKNASSIIHTPLSSAKELHQDITNELTSNNQSNVGSL